jgi:hypothetical protein
MLFLNLIVASLLVVLTFGIHFIGLVGLSAGMRRLGAHPAKLTTLLGQGLAILSLVIALFALHAIEVWVYAVAYLMLGALSGLEPALYYSSSAFSTVGFGDVTLGVNWRMLGAAESLNGFLLIGWSTAFLVSVTARVRVFASDAEHLED